MNDQPVDRRVRRTRRAFHAAVLALVMETPLEDLTVTAITEEAGLRRATFYLHYDSKEDLLLAALSDEFDGLAGAVASAGGFGVEAGCVALFAHTKEKERLYRRVLADATVAAALRTRLAGVAGGAVDSEIAAQFAAGALVGVVLWWLAQAEPRSPGAMGREVFGLLHDGMG